MSDFRPSPWPSISTQNDARPYRGWRKAQRPGGCVVVFAGAVVVVAVLVFGASQVGVLRVPDINGKAGITVDAQGHPIVVAELCHGSVKRVRVFGPYDGVSSSRVDADLSAASQKKSFTLDPSSPGSDWSGQRLLLPITDEQRRVSLTSGRKSLLQEVTFTPQDLAGLRPGTVKFDTYNGGEPGHSTVDIADFHRLACGE